nr:hypothetical protein JVH1_0335 [Rhodococcus sp. JVH1]
MIEAKRPTTRFADVAADEFGPGDREEPDARLPGDRAPSTSYPFRAVRS